jgi:gamma-glutamylcyclotransferase (GGCT)/AIG2-like uncharacterized protein YtfP
MLIAVYGSLRKGCHNHNLLEKKEVTYMGRFDTLPIYTLKSLTHYPALIEKGTTSIVMEVYKVDKVTSESVNRLEGYLGTNNSNNLYNKETILTPYGEASVFLFANAKRIENHPICEGGDWKDYLSTRLKIN